MYKGFAEFHHAAFAAGALDVKTKELIAFAIGGVAMLMNGGPATIYGPRAYAAFCEFAATPTATPN